MEPSSPREGLFGFSPEQFCDEVYDYVDDYLADGMDEMEEELLKVAARVDSREDKDLEEAIHSCCDNFQKEMQKEFDKNLDIFDRYVKKNVFAAIPEHILVGCGTGGSNGLSGEEGMPGMAVDSDKGLDSGMETAEWEAELHEGMGLPTADEERALDIELEELRRRRRKADRRRKELSRTNSRLVAVSEMTNEFVEALKAGVESIIDENGLAPLPNKVKEAVDASAELRGLTAEAIDLTRRIKEELSRGSGKAGSGASSPQLQGIQAEYQQARQQVVTGGQDELAELVSKLKGSQ
ncbi:unnamed protein product [Choristocarpus tenellus]